MRIRRLLKDDAPLFRALRLRALKTNPEAFSDAYEDALERSLEQFRERIPEADSDDAIFVAEADGQFVGMVGFYRERGIKRRHRGWIWGVYVDPEWRGQGIGRALFDTVAAHARQVDGLRQLLLTVITVNTAAMCLYESFGFEAWGVELAAVQVGGRFYDEMHMAASLEDIPF